MYFYIIPLPHLLQFVRYVTTTFYSFYCAYMSIAFENSVNYIGS